MHALEPDGFIPQGGLVSMEVATYRAFREIGAMCEPDLRGLSEAIAATVVSVRSSGGQMRSSFRVVGRAWQVAGGDDDAVFGELSLSGDHFIGGLDYIFRLALGAADLYDIYFNIPSRSNKRRYRNKFAAATLHRLGIEARYEGQRFGYVPTGFATSHLDRYLALAAALDEYLVLRTPTEAAVEELMNDVAALEQAGAHEPTERRSRYVFASCGCQDSRGKARTIRVAVGSWVPDSIHYSICSHPFAVPVEGDVA